VRMLIYEDHEIGREGRLKADPYLSAYIPKSTNTISEECWQLATNWINNCIQYHGNCRSLEGKDTCSWYPTRLIDVGISLHAPVLCITNESMITGGYASLSHRWGAGTFPLLSSTNIEDFKVGITYSSLSKTFQDALLITKRLGLRYLWIDSLCILQSGPGSAEDWQTESKLMGNVYRNSFCNISATGSQSSGDGLFRERHPLSVSKTSIQIDWKSKNNEPNRTNHTSTCCRDHYLLDDDIYTSGLDGSDLLNRGWVLQERLLAPRILHFGHSQLYWECNELQACETLPTGLGSRFGNRNAKNNLLDLKRSRHFATPKTEAQGASEVLLHKCYLPRRVYRPSNAHEHRCQTRPHGFNEALYFKNLIRRTWASIIKRYTSYGLTLQSDRLIALSGVAKHFAYLGDMDVQTYFAGHWHQTLPRSLLWKRRYTSYKYIKDDLPVMYIAPSWSWACSEGEIDEIDFEGETVGWDYCLTDTVMVLDVRVTPASGDATGQISWGEIKLRGPAVLFSSVQGDLKVEVEGKLLGAVGYEIQTHTEKSKNPDWKPKFCYWLDETNIEGPVPGDTWCLLVSLKASRQDRHKQRRAHTVIYGLLLVRASTEDERFKRVGFFCFLFEGKCPKYFEDTPIDFCVI
jgi:hypothetical protein